MKIAFSFLTALALPMSCVVSAEVFKSIEPNGRIYYSEKTLASLYKQYTTPTPVRVRAKTKRTRFPKRYNPLIKAAAKRYGVDPRLVHAVIRAESGYRPDAVSPKGAIGLMQLMPPTAKRFGVVDSYNPEQNINGGTQYLSELIELFDSDIALALAAYNAGEHKVIKYGNNIPPYNETRDYVVKVMALYGNAWVE